MVLICGMISRTSLIKQNTELLKNSADWMAVVERQNEEIIILKEKNITLEARIKELEQTKNSTNSSIPPSKDENRKQKNLSLREKSGLKVGGQPGHVGHTLLMSENPTNIVFLKPDVCSNCGNNLSNNSFDLIEKRQVFDIPPIKPIITEFQKFRTVCTCGICSTGAFPAEVVSPIQYGKQVQNLTVYLNVRQFMPFNRIKEFFSCVCSLDLSEGTIQNILKSMAEKAMPAYELIKQEVEKAKVLGGDETSVRIDGKKNWFWTVQNTILTFLWCAKSRSFQSLKTVFPNGLPNAIVCHDAYATWFQLATRKHQLCMAHLLRDLKYFEQYEPCKWTEQIKFLFYESLKWKENHPYENHNFDKQLSKIQENPPDNPSKKLKAFIKRLKKHEKSLFVFLDHKHVPSDNNGSERAIRNIKVKTKVSGQFKSIENANIFAVLRSVIDTLIKNKQPVFEKLDFLTNFKAE